MTDWETLRNPKTPFAPSVSDEFIIVPIMESPKILGWAAVRLADLKPEFKTLKDAQEWADGQSERPSHKTGPTTNPPKEGKK